VSGDTPDSPAPLTPSTTSRDISIPAGEGDGIYDVGKLSHDARFLRVNKGTNGSYRRYTLDDGNVIVFRKV